MAMSRAVASSSRVAVKRVLAQASEAKRRAAMPTPRAAMTAMSVAVRKRGDCMARYPAGPWGRGYGAIRGIDEFIRRYRPAVRPGSSGVLVVEWTRRAVGAHYTPEHERIAHREDRHA